MLVKLKPSVNFINILSTNFSYESARILLPKRRSYEKFVRKMLMKLTAKVVFLLFFAIYLNVWNGTKTKERALKEDF